MSEADLLARVDALAKRVRELEDKQAIRDVIARYCFHADGRRNEELLALCTDDVVMESATGPQVTRNEGIEGFRRMVEDPDGHSHPDYYGKGLHMLGVNFVVHLDGDNAVANSYSIMLHRNANASEIIVRSASNNHWELRQVDGEWRISKRRRRGMGDEDFAENLSATPR